MSVTIGTHGSDAAAEAWALGDLAGAPEAARESSKTKLQLWAQKNSRLVRQLQDEAREAQAELETVEAERDRAEERHALCSQKVASLKKQMAHLAQQRAAGR